MLDHLLETQAIVRRWGQPGWLQDAALIHSVYGTDAYHQQLFPVSRREEVIEAAGPRAERLAYLFCVTARGPLLAGTHRWARDLPALADPASPGPGDQAGATRDELDALVLLHMANLAEQARARDGSPGGWLVRLRAIAELLIDSDAVALPSFIAKLATFSEADESLARRAYRAGVDRGDDPATSASRLALAAAVCPVVPEPCLWQAYLCWGRHDLPAVQWWGQCARRRLLELGTVWDKRLSFGQWVELARIFERPTSLGLRAGTGPITDPRGLVEALRGGHSGAGPRSAAPKSTPRPIAPPDAEAGRQRFRRYVESLAEADDDALGRLYPDLASRPWYDPQEFALASYLESHYTAIRDEILALEPSRFHPESEAIRRSGDWDVAFLYERGHRRDQLCDACPVTTRGVETYPTMRTVAGLIYASRMRGATHIRAHRGPTNLRVRCHLGIQVPDGDCAIRVGEQARRWEDGKCLVFDDHFEHEAWNHTDEDRIVLIVDMWHPGLSATEVSLLEGLHQHTYSHARRLSRYWSANAVAAVKASAKAD